MNLQQIKYAIAELTPTEFAAFADWFAEFQSVSLDRRIEADCVAGKLDGVIRQAMDDIDAGQCRVI
jgi:hypothetical protein